MASSDEGASSSLHSSDATNRNIATVTLTNDSQKSKISAAATRSSSSSGISGNSAETTDYRRRITKSRSRARASTLPDAKELESFSIFDKSAFGAARVASGSVGSQGSTAAVAASQNGREVTPTIVRTKSASSVNQKSNTGLVSASVKINTPGGFAATRVKDTRPTQKVTQPQRNSSCQNIRSGVEVLSSTSELPSTSRAGNQSTRSLTRNNLNNNDKIPTRTTCATVATKVTRSLTSSSESQHNTVTSVTSSQAIMTSQGPSLPVTVARGTVASVSVSSRSQRNASPTRVNYSSEARGENASTAPRAIYSPSEGACGSGSARGDIAAPRVSSSTGSSNPQPPQQHYVQRSQRSQPSRSQGANSRSSSPERTTSSNQRSRKATNQNRQQNDVPCDQHRQRRNDVPASRDQSSETIRLAPNVSSSSNSDNQNVVAPAPQPRALDPSQLTVDVLQNTRRQRNSGGNNGGENGGATGNSSTPESPSPTHRIQQWCENINREALPDILNSHLLPPYAPPQSRVHHENTNNRNSQLPQQEMPTNAPRGSAPANRAYRARAHQRGRTGGAAPGITQIEGSDKECCSKRCCISCVTTATTFRWVLVAVAVLGVVCVAIGIVLGSLHITIAKQYLTLSLLFIGLGVLLVVVVGVGWRCTPQGHEPCHVLLSLGVYSNPPSNRSHGRGNRARREREWHGGPLYAEFQQRRPPPSYNASMHQYQQQQRAAAAAANSQNASRRSNSQDAAAVDNLSLPSSPPPTYRSRASTSRPGIHITFPVHRGGEAGDAGDYPTSRPPTYRSHAGDTHERRPGIAGLTQGAVEGFNSSSSGSNGGGSRTVVETHVMQTYGSDEQEIATMQIHNVDMQPMPHPTRINSNTYTRRVHTVDNGDSAAMQIASTSGQDSVVEVRRGSVDSPFSTLHRVNQVVQYLDGVLNEESGGGATPSEFSTTPPRSRVTSAKRSHSNAGTSRRSNTDSTATGSSQNRARSHSNPHNPRVVDTENSMMRMENSMDVVPSTSTNTGSARAQDPNTTDGKKTNVYKIEMSGTLGGVNFDLNLRNLRRVNHSDRGDIEQNSAVEQNVNNANSNLESPQSIESGESSSRSNPRNTIMAYSNEQKLSQNSTSGHRASNVATENHQTNMSHNQHKDNLSPHRKKSVTNVEHRGVGSTSILYEAKSDAATQTGSPLAEESSVKPEVEQEEEEEEISDTQL